MNLNTFRKTITVSALGLAFLLGTTEIANAQTDKKEQREQQKAAKRQREAQMRRAGIEDLRIKADQKREQMRIKKIPMITSDANRYRINRNGTYYETNNRGAELLKQAVNAGYQEGYRSGRNDRNRNRTSDYKISPVYRKGNYGYQKYVNSGQYQYYFQQGFERGYDDGFNTRFENGTSTNGSVNILENILQNILTIESY